MLMYARPRALANIYVPQMSTVNVNLYNVAATLRICQQQTHVSQKPRTDNIFFFHFVVCFLLFLLF